MFYVVPLLTFEIVVKNSGIMWVAVILFDVVYYLVRNNSYNLRHIKPLALRITLPVLFRYLWNKHVELVFASGNTSKHTMSAEYYSSTLAEKTNTDIMQIVSMFAEKVFSLRDEIWILLGILIVMLLIGYFSHRKLIKRINGLFILSISIYIVYQVGNLVMYLVSMPLGEALRLAGYQRYVLTAEFVVWGIAIMVLFATILKIKRDVTYMICVPYAIAFGMIILLLKTDNITSILKHKVPVNGREASRTHLDTIIEKYQLQQGKNVLSIWGILQIKIEGIGGICPDLYYMQIL